METSGVQTQCYCRFSLRPFSSPNCPIPSLSVEVPVSNVWSLKWGKVEEWGVSWKTKWRSWLLSSLVWLPLTPTLTKPGHMHLVYVRRIARSWMVMMWWCEGRWCRCDAWCDCGEVLKYKCQKVEESVYKMMDVLFEWIWGCVSEESDGCVWWNCHCGCDLFLRCREERGMLWDVSDGFIEMKGWS